MVTIKHVLTIALLVITATVTAQTVHTEDNTNLNKSFTNDGKTLHIKISGTINKKPVSFNRVYNIKGLQKMQVDSIKKHVTDSLGIN